MNSQKGYVLIIDTSGDVTDIIDDASEQPWFSTGHDPQPKGLPCMPASRAWAKIGQSYLQGWKMSGSIFL